MIAKCLRLGGFSVCSVVLGVLWRLAVDSKVAWFWCCCLDSRDCGWGCLVGAVAVVVVDFVVRYLVVPCLLLGLLGGWTCVGLVRAAFWMGFHISWFWVCLGFAVRLGSGGCFWVWWCLFWMVVWVFLSFLVF